MIVVSQIATPLPRSLTPRMTVAEGGRWMMEDRVHGMPVVDGTGRAIGVLSTTDVARAALEDALREPVSRWMTVPPLTIEPGATLYEAIRRMVGADVRRLLVLDSAGRPSGIVTPTDLLRAEANLAEGFRLRSPESKEERSP